MTAFSSSREFIASVRLLAGTHAVASHHRVRISARNVLLRFRNVGGFLQDGFKIGIYNERRVLLVFPIFKLEYISILVG